MGMQRDIEIEIAVAPAVDPFSPLAREAQALAVGGAAGNAHLELARDTAHEPILVVFGHRELELDLGTVKSLLERDVDRNLVVLARHADFAPGALGPPTSRQSGKKVRQVDILESGWRFAELLPPFRRRPEFLTGGVAPELVVRGALFRVLERRVRFRDFLEFLLGAAFLGDVGVVLPRELPIRLLDVVFAGVARDPEDRVIVFVFHGAARRRRRVTLLYAVPSLGCQPVAHAHEAASRPNPRGKDGYPSAI